MFFFSLIGSKTKWNFHFIKKKKVKKKNISERVNEREISRRSKTKEWSLNLHMNNYYVNEEEQEENA